MSVSDPCAWRIAWQMTQHRQTQVPLLRSRQKTRDCPATLRAFEISNRLSQTTSHSEYHHHPSTRVPVTPKLRSAIYRDTRRPAPDDTMSTITEITSMSLWEQTLASTPSDALLIVSFHAPWAAPCAQMATVLSTLAGDYPVTEPLSTRWVSLNAEELEDVTEEYDVTSVPCLVLLRGGQLVDKVSGSSAVKVRTAIDTHAKRDAATITTAPVETPQETADPARTKEELDKRLRELVKAAPVMLFMKGTPGAPQCGFSRQLVALLRENSVKYGFFNILADDEVRQGLKEFADWPTYPQLWVDGDLVGGLDIVS